MSILNVSYSIWKQAAQSHSWWVAYHYVEGSETRKVWTGDRDHLFTSHVPAESFSDWQSNFGAASQAVAKPDDAVAQICGLTGLRPRPISADGTPVYGKQQLALGRTSFKRLDNGTELLNVDGRPAGSTVVVWNGAADTGGDWVTTGSGSQTAGSAHSGTQGWDSGAVGANDYTDFDNGTPVDVAGSYSALSFWIQPQAFPGNAQLQVQWRNAAGTVIGTTLDVPGYLTNMDLGVWKKVTIPITDFNLTASVQKLRVAYKVGNQQHYLDDVELQSAGGAGPYVFRASSPTGYIYHVERVILVVSAGDTGWASTAFGNLAGGLTNGVLLKYHRIGASPETYWSFNCRNNLELFGQFEAFNTVGFDNSEQLVAFSLHPELSSVILVDDDEVLDFVVRDDLRSMVGLRAFLHYGQEVRV